MRIISYIPSLFLLLSLASCTMQAEQSKSGQRTTITAKEAPQPIGPYSQAVAANGFLFVSGQIGSSAQTGKLVTESFEAEATQVMENLKAILTKSGVDFSKVVKATIYVKDISQFAKVNKIYGQYFTADPPARETVQVANLPANANIEISVIAVLN